MRILVIFHAIITIGSVQPSNNGHPTFHDDFEGPTLDTSKWQVQHWDGNWKNNELECYHPDNVKIENGHLVLTASAKKKDDPVCGNQQYWSGSIESKECFLHGTIKT